MENNQREREGCVLRDRHITDTTTHTPQNQSTQEVDELMIIKCYPLREHIERLYFHYYLALFFVCFSFERKGIE